MPAKLLLGKPLADLIYQEVQDGVENIKRLGKSVTIRAVLVGEDPSSLTYLRIKQRMCEKCGIEYQVDSYPASISESELVKKLEDLNKDPGVNGIIVQLPLPAEMDTKRVLTSISPEKDIDAFNFIFDKDSGYMNIPPTPKGMTEILIHNHIEIYQKDVVVVGNGLLVGMPLMKLLNSLEARIVQTEDLDDWSISKLKKADIVFTGVGKADLIKPEMLKNGVVLVDAGYDKVGDEIHGDVDPKCADVASAMTPPIGGIGPLTVANLLKNAVELTEKQYGL